MALSLQNLIVIVIKSNKFVAIVTHIRKLLYFNANHILIIREMGI
jgi:hypothetical protein